MGELHRTDDHTNGRDSMNRTGPREGDVVTIRSTPKAKNGDVVVARLGDEVTLKRFVRLDERHVELRPDSHNREHETIRIDLARHILHIEGGRCGGAHRAVGKRMSVRSDPQPPAVLTRTSFSPRGETPSTW